MTYSELLKDPRWQKKRLKIMERDSFTCQVCLDTKMTLHIHHRRYIRGKKPWEYPDELLVTMCEQCHSYETQEREYLVAKLNAILQDYYFADQVGTLVKFASHFTKGSRYDFQKFLATAFVNHKNSEDEIHTHPKP